MVPGSETPSNAIRQRIKLTIAYDGRPFAGWQMQAGRPSVQGEIEDALRKVSGGERVPLHGSGRSGSRRARPWAGRPF